MPLKYLNRFNNSSVISAGNSVLFNGSNQYLTATRSGGWLKSANNFTMECWVYFTRHPSAYGGYYGSHMAGTADHSYGWEFGFGSSNGSSTTSVGFSVKQGGGVGVSRAFNTNTWYHFAVVRSGTTVTLYVDGTSASTATISSWTDTTQLKVGALNLSPYFYYFPGYISNFRIVEGTAVYTSNFTPSTTPLTAIANTVLLTCQSATIVDNSSNNFTVTNNGTATVSSTVPFTASFTPAPSGVRFLNRSNVPTVLPGTQKAIFGYGTANVTNLVSNTGVVANDTAGVGTSRFGLAAAGYGTDKAIFGYGYDYITPYASSTNKVSNTGVVATDTAGVGTGRRRLAAAGYGSDKAIFGFGDNSSYLSMTNKVSNTGVVASDTSGGIEVARLNLAAASYGTDKAIFGYGYKPGGKISITSLVSNTGVVAGDTTGVGTVREYLAAASYGSDKAIFGYGTDSSIFSMTNKVSNTGVVAYDTTGVGTARYGLAAAGYGSDKAIFGYGLTSGYVSMTNLVSNTGVVSTDTTGVGTARYELAAAGYSVTITPASSNFKVKKIFADPTIVTSGLVLNLDASNASSYPGSGTSWFDLSGNSNTGTLTNGPTFNSANGGSIVFDGSDDYVNLGNAPSIKMGTGDFTISTWVKILTQTGTATFKGIISSKQAGAASAGYGFYWNNSVNKFLWSTGNGSSSSEIFTTNAWSSLVNVWANIVMIRQNGATNNGHFYINGVYEPLASAATVLNVDTTTNMTLGNVADFYSPYWFTGTYGATQIYNRALTASEILQNYNVTKTRFGL
jgi:hypothetical protein